MKLGNMFPSRFLKGSDLDGHTPIVTIEKVVMETLKDPQTGEEESKPVVYFDGKDKGLILNITNGKAIAAVVGSDDSDAWRGSKIQLFTSMVEAFGKTTEAIRVRGVKGNAATPPQKTGNQTPENSNRPDLADDDLPF